MTIGGLESLTNLAELTPFNSFPIKHETWSSAEANKCLDPSASLLCFGCHRTASNPFQELLN